MEHLAISKVNTCTGAISYLQIRVLVVVLVGMGLMVYIQSPATNRFNNHCIFNKRGVYVQTAHIVCR